MWPIVTIAGLRDDNGRCGFNMERGVRSALPLKWSKAPAAIDGGGRQTKVQGWMMEPKGRKFLNHQSELNSMYKAVFSIFPT